MPHSRTRKSRQIVLPALLRNTSPYQPELPERWVLTASSIRLIRRCPRKFFWAKIMRLRQRHKPESLFIGHIVHKAIEEWFRNRRSSMARIALRLVTEAREELEGHAPLYDQDEYDKIQAQVTAAAGMLEGYARIYKADRKRKPIAVEKQFNVDRGDFDFRGKIDLIMPHGKRNHLIDHKTASKIGSAFVERLPMDTQMRSYVYGAMMGLDIPIHNVVYDILRKPSLRRKTDERIEDFTDRLAADYEARPDHYFLRVDLKYSKADIAAFEFEMQQAWKFLSLILDGEFGDPRDPRTWAIDDAECMAYFRLCPFHSLCTSCLDKGSALMFDQAEALHDELEGE